jgi:F-type H+-transporting ATPase subunit epsilon
MTLQVNLCIPTQPVANLTATYVQLPSISGSMGILRGHAPLRCELAAGVVMCRLSDESVRVFSVSSGLAVIRNDTVTILADTAEDAKNIDPSRAQAARERAVGRLSGGDPGLIDRTRAEAALRRALARLEAVRMVGKQ